MIAIFHFLYKNVIKLIHWDEVDNLLMLYNQWHFNIFYQKIEWYA